MSVFGDTLRQARVSKGVTLREAEQATRINRHHLSALEEEDFAVLPPLIYQRGIVRNYSAYLDLDPGKSLAMFEEARGGDSAAELVAAVKPLEMPRHWSPNFAIIAFMVVMGAVIFAWVYSISFSQEPVASTVPPAVPTVTPIPDDRLALPSPTAIPTATATPPADRHGGPIASDHHTAGADGRHRAPADAGREPARANLSSRGGAAASRRSRARRRSASLPRATFRSPLRLTASSSSPDGWAQAAPRSSSPAANFAVTTSDGSLTLFENAATGQQFYMGYGQNETYYLGG